MRQKAYRTGAQIFQKSGSLLKTLGARKATRSTFHAEDPQIVKRQHTKFSQADVAPGICTSLHYCTMKTSLELFTVAL